MPKRLSRRKIAAPKATVDIPSTITITLADVPTAWFANSKSSQAIRRLELTERELIARAYAESRSATLDEWIHAALLSAAKPSIVNAARSRVDYAAAYERLRASGVEITASRLGREARDRTGKISGNARSAAAWLAKNGGR